jgi:hypothetical protein
MRPGKFAASEAQGVMAIAKGSSPTLIAAPALLVAVEIGVTVPEFWLAT